MKILITGGAGFIGSNIADELIKEGHEVVIVDDLSHGRKENISRKARFYKLAVEDRKLEDVFKKEMPDIVNHHAAQIDVRKSVQDPMLDARINIMGFLNVMENSVKYHVKKVINVSSGGVVYGEPDKFPITEDFPKKPISPYGIAKNVCENYLYFYNRTHGLKYTTLRYSNVYGPRQDPHGEAGVVAIFTQILLSKKTPTIFGDGRQERDYVYVKDVVSANVFAMTNGNNEAYNIGTGRRTSVNELFRILREITGYPGEAVHAAARPGEVQTNCLSAEKAAKELGWKPVFSLEDGLRETVEWIKAHK